MGATSDSNRYNFPERAGEFIAELIDPDSPNKFNVEGAAKSAMGMSEQTAHKQSYKLMQDKRIQNAVERALEARGAGRIARAGFLLDIAQNMKSRTTKRYDKEGNLVEKIESEPTFSDMIKAIDTLNRMDGTYTEQKNVSDRDRDEHRLLLKQIMLDARKMARAKKIGADGTGEAVDASFEQVAEEEKGQENSEDEEKDQFPENS